MSDANRVKLGLSIAETTFGTAPTSAVTKEIRTTGESLKQTTNTVTSQELRSDRNLADLLRVGIQGDGDINFELSYLAGNTALSDLMLFTLQPVLGGYGGFLNSNGPTISAISDGALSYSGQFTSTSVFGPNGTWFKLFGWDLAGTPQPTWNGIWKIISGGGTNVVQVIGTHDMATGSCGSVGTGQKQTLSLYCTNGTTQKSFAVERAYLDIGAGLPNPDQLELFSGCVIDKMQLAVGADKLVTGSFSILAKNAASTTSTICNGGYANQTPANTDSVISGVDSVQAILENQDPLIVTAFTLAYSNNLRGRQVVGTLGLQSVGAGSVTVTGTLTAYFSSKAIVDRYLNATATNLSLIIQSVSDYNGPFMVFDMPQVKFTSGQVVATGLNSDVMVEMGWQAVLDVGEVNVLDSNAKFTLRLTKGT